MPRILIVCQVPDCGCEFRDVDEYFQHKASHEHSITNAKPEEKEN